MVSMRLQDTQEAAVLGEDRQLHDALRQHPVDLLRKSGEFPMSYEELDDTAATVYEGI
jgi:hypothetical protein